MNTPFINEQDAKPVIAIDGTSGAGKSTLARALARINGYRYIDSGLFYRAVAFEALRNGLELEDPMPLAQIARTLDISFVSDGDSLRVYIDDLDITKSLQEPEVAQATSIMAKAPAIRKEVICRLRQMSEVQGLIMAGRDIGTNVFPSANVKLFLDASLDARARRRWEEECKSGRLASLEQVKNEIEERDRRDRERSTNPLVKADDAILIDTSNLSKDEVLKLALAIITKTYIEP